MKKQKEKIENLEKEMLSLLQDFKREVRNIKNDCKEYKARLNSGSMSFLKEEYWL